MKWSFKFPYFVDGFTRRQEKGGYQGTHSLAIACGYAAQDVVALSAINGRSHYVSLKLNILQGFSSQDTGESGCMIPENRAAVQAVMGAFASAGCMLAETSPSSPLSQLSFHCQLHPPSEKLSNEMRWEQLHCPTPPPPPLMCLKYPALTKVWKLKYTSTPRMWPFKLWPNSLYFVVHLDSN